MTELKRVHISRIVDGDTVVVSSSKKGGKELKLRLYGIDAPESSQTYGSQSTHALTAFINDLGNEVYMQSHGRPEKYHRTLATLYTKKHPHDAIENINYKMVLWGYAWSYRFTKEEAERGGPIVPSLDTYDTAETVARLSKRGLWEDKFHPAMRPSKYRRQKRRDQRKAKRAKAREARKRKQKRSTPNSSETESSSS